MEIRNFINYRVNPRKVTMGKAVKDNTIVGLVENFRTVRTMSPRSELMNRLEEYHNEVSEVARKRMYGVDDGIENIPFYMLNEKELAYATDINRFVFQFTEAEKDDFAYMTELIFSNAELEYEFLSNMFEQGDGNFVFEPSSYNERKWLEEIEQKIADGNTLNDDERRFYDMNINETARQYNGKFPNYNCLISKIYRCVTRNDLKDVKQMSSMEYSALMYDFNLFVTIKLWERWKKVYTLSRDLYDDFIENFKAGTEIEIPVTTLRNIPFDTFFLNLRGFGMKVGTKTVVDGAYIKLLRNEERVFGVTICSVCAGGLTTGSMLVDINKEIEDGETFTISKGLFTGTLDTTNWHDIHGDGRKMKKNMARLMFLCMETVFYLCCTNKKMSGKKYVNLNPAVKNTAEVEDVTIGFVFTNELRARIKESEGTEEEVFVNNTGKGRHRPHLVRGHFHHYHTKNGTILKYIEPYFTGTNTDYISKTVCRK